MSRHAYKPTDKDREVVKAMASYGVPQEDIGRVVGCSHVTLRKHFEAELDTAGIRANSKVAERLFSDCMKDDPRYQVSRMFWLKTRAGWRDENYTHRFVDEQGRDRKLLDLASVRAFMRSVPDAPSE